MALVLGALTLMAVDYRNPVALAPVRTAFSILTYPLQLVVDAPYRAYDDTVGFFSPQTALALENATLKKQVRFYSAQQRTMLALQEENKRLRGMLDAAPHGAYEFKMAEILEASGDRLSGLVTLNEGSRDGVYESQVVLSGENIYGQVISVNPFSSTVMQLVDRGHTIPVRNQRTGERALASGAGRGNPLELKNLPANSDIHEGDIWVSSGLGKLFPVDFPVAKVIPGGVQFKPGDAFATVKAKPLVNYEGEREVLLLWKKDAAGKLIGAQPSETPEERAGP